MILLGVSDNLEDEGGLIVDSLSFFFIIGECLLACYL